MRSKKRQELEFQYYEVPHGERLLALSQRGMEQAEGGIEQAKLQFHNLFEVGHCLEGEGEAVLDGVKIAYRHGAVAMIPPNIPHAIYGGGLWESLFFNPEDLLLECYPDNLLFVRKALGRVSQGAYLFAEGQNKRIAMLVQMILEEHGSKTAYSGEYIRGLLLALLMGAAGMGVKSGDAMEQGQHRGGISRISGALNYINENYMETIKISTLAGACNLSETHFRRLFAECVNMAPLEYINLVRVQQACSLIQKNRYSMEEVAAQVGYASVSSFNRNFRKVEGISPYQYNKRRQ